MDYRRVPDDAIGILINEDDSETVTIEEPETVMKRKTINTAKEILLANIFY